MKSRIDYHEAGHAVLASAFGLKIDALFSFSSEGRMLFRATRPTTESSHYQRQQWLMVQAGGLMAECLHHGGNFIEWMQKHEIGADVKNMLAIEPSAKEILLACHTASVYLSQNWQAVERLADGLGECSMAFPENISAACNNLPDPFELLIPQRLGTEIDYANKAAFHQLVLQHRSLAPTHSWVSWWGVDESAVIRSAVL